MIAVAPAIGPDALTASVEEIIAQTQADPVWFIEGLLGEKLWDGQKAIARAVFKHRRVAVPACNSSGKTRSAAGIALAFLYGFPGSKVITTAPTAHQVENLLWGDLRALFPRLPARMGGRCYAGRPRVFLDDQWWAIGLSTNEGVRFQGHHAPKMLFIVDEAVGVEADTFEAIEGNRAGGDVHLLLLGNPTAPSGDFYNACLNRYHAEVNPFGWLIHRISAFSTPNFAGLGINDDGDDLAPLLALTHEQLQDNPWPFLTTKSWVKEKYQEWTPSSPMWQGRVCGWFPEEASDSLISLRWLEKARTRPRSDCDEPFDIGIDVAGPGEDETVVYVRAGDDVVDFRTYATPDPRESVTDYLGKWMQSGREVRKISVDCVGIGYNFALHLQDWLRSLPGVEKTDSRVKLVNVGEAANSDGYANRRAEEYWGLRMRFKDAPLAGLTDSQTYLQLAGIKYKQTETGKVQIEKKEDARKRGVKSPDRADALMLAFASDRSPGMLGWVEQRYRELLAKQEAAKAAAAQGGNV